MACCMALILLKGSATRIPNYIKCESEPKLNAELTLSAWTPGLIFLAIMLRHARATPAEGWC